MPSNGRRDLIWRVKVKCISRTYHLTPVLFSSYMRVFVQTRQKNVAKNANEDWWQLCKCLRTLITSDTTQQCVNLWVCVTGKVAHVDTMKVMRGGKAPLIHNFTTQLLEISLMSQQLYSSQKESQVSIKQKSTRAPEVV